MALTMHHHPSWSEKILSREDGTAHDGSRVFDDSLTSLSWLHNLNIMGEIHAPTLPTPPASPGPLSGIEDYDAYCSSGGGEARRFAADLRNGVGLMGPPTSGCVLLGSAGHGSSASSSSAGRKNRSAASYHQLVVDNVDYKTNGDVKPPYSYATLICMAMKANKNKMSLSAIYKWIRDNFMYYRRADTGWQNSIRHNLSLNKCFIKVPRNKDEPGKGGFWRLDPKFAEEMADGTFKKRRMANRPTPKKVVGMAQRDKGGLVPMDHHQLQAQQDVGSPMMTTSSQQQQQLTPYFLHPAPPPLAPPTSQQSHMLLDGSLLPLTTMATSPHVLPATLSPPTDMELHGMDDNLLSPEDEAETAAATASLKGDFCWNSVLNEDIEVDGLRYKTLDIVDMDGVATDLATTYRTALSHLQAASSMMHHHHHDNEGAMAGCLDSPALSLDDDDLLVSDASNDPLSDTLDLTVHGGGHVTTAEWWRLPTACSDGSSPLSSSSSSLAPGCTDPNAPILMSNLGGSAYNMAGAAAAAAFLGHDWDDVGRPVLDGALDLDGLVDLDVY